MKIVFANDDLMKECNNQELLIKRHGAELSRVLRQRLDELFTARSLEEMRSMPHVGISGNPSGNADLTLDLSGGTLLAFRPHPPRKSGHGGMDWNKIDSILILGLRK